jgi:hypothetical protein
VEEDAHEGGSMAEQIPEAWVGHEVIVYFGQDHQDAGTLAAVADKGIVVRTILPDSENVYWYPYSSITRILHSRP